MDAEQEFFRLQSYSVNECLAIFAPNRMPTCADNWGRFACDVEFDERITGVAKRAGDDLPFTGLDGWTGKNSENSGLTLDVELFDVQCKGAVGEGSGLF